MIDCHAHILPGVDDGPETLDEAMAMARRATGEGIAHMIATPHYVPERFDPSRVGPAYATLQKALLEAELPLVLSLGNELQLDAEGVKALEEGLCLPLGNSTHVLVELPHSKMYPIHETWLYELGLMGYTPVLAHVDRYPYLTEEPDTLRRLLAAGCVSQMNASAILRPETRRAAMKLISEELVHLVASDCHSTVNRPPALKDAFALVAKAVGAPMAEDLFCNNGERLLERQSVIREWPGKIPAKAPGWFQWLRR